MNYLKEQLFQILRISRNKYFRIKFKSLQKKIIDRKHGQKDNFERLKRNFVDYYTKLQRYDITNFTTPLWKEFNKRLKKVFLPRPPFNFLQDPTIMVTMFATAGGKWLNEELQLLKKSFSKKELEFLLEEDYVGEPLILNKEFLTSHNSIDHLYHLAKYQTVTGIDLKKIKTIVEWGAGYGNMIKILRRLKSGKGTYILIDTPLFSCLQWLYLSTILGESTINLLADPSQTVKTNKINIIPLSILPFIRVEADLFISTWALSESSIFSQDYVNNHNWFGAEHLLLAYQENPTGFDDPVRVGKLASKMGARILDIEFLSGNHYAFI